MFKNMKVKYKLWRIKLNLFFKNMKRKENG